MSLDSLIVGLLVCYMQTTLRCSIFVGFLLVHLAIFLLSQIIESEPSGWGEPPPVVDQNTLDLVSAVQRGALERWNLEEKEHVRYHFLLQGKAAVEGGCRSWPESGRCRGDPSALGGNQRPARDRRFAP